MTARLFPPDASSQSICSTLAGLNPDTRLIVTPRELLGLLALAGSVDDWLSLREAAAVAGATTSCLRKWIRQGHLPAKKAGAKLWRVRRGDVVAARIARSQGNWPPQSTLTLTA